MSARGRALSFGAAALFCAVLAAAAAGSYGSSAAQRYGELRDVVVSRVEIQGKSRISPGQLSKLFEIRRVPVDFAPPDTLSDPAQALGAKPTLALPPGSYVTRSELTANPPDRQDRKPAALAGRSPVELTVSGGDALASLAR